MVAVSKLGKSFGGRTLFENVSLQLNEGARYGLVGANGSGKTTFLKILAGDEQQTDGQVIIPARARVGVLRQDRFLDDDKIILEQAMMGELDVWNALQERARIIDHGEGDATRLADLEDTLANFDGYTLEARATEVLEGLGIPFATHQSPLKTLSGGFKLRVLLAQVLVGGPDALFLDEPTNHLDILSIRWLEKFLADYRGVALVISHDQRFLDNVATHILDVDYETITPYTGNYTSFLQQKEAIRTQKEGQIARAEKIIADKRAFVDRFGAKASKAKQAQSRLRQIERVEVEELKSTSRRSPYFKFAPARQSGRDVLEIEGLSKSYGTNEVLRNMSFVIRRGEKVAVIGPNGLGKSTLLKIVTGAVKHDSGTMKLGHEVKIGYFAQDHHDVLKNAKMTPLDYMWEACPPECAALVRGHLGRVLFSGDDVMKPIGSLSGGEAARLVFGRIIIEQPNMLVLDEPTNHLDLESIQGLSAALKAYEGTLLFVSHDRWFVSEVATRIIELTPSGPRDFPGTYAEYLERSGDDHLDADAVVASVKAKTKTERPKPAEGNKLSYEEQKRERNRIQGLPKLRDKALAQIEAAEARKKEIAALYDDPQFYMKTPHDKMEELVKENNELTGKIEKWMGQWEAYEAEINSLKE
ncbi:MAG: ABC-F family ATP-binding cassette domain-containing protein [Sandaracinaceae bacterium]|nr:ABC-F family ATP-binding cassette domain-containing protein [Sandaracinaceae bacterium]